MNKPIGIQTQEIFSHNSSSNHSELNADYYDSTKKIKKSIQTTPQLLHTSQVLHQSSTQEIFSQHSSSNHSELNTDYYDSINKINKSAQSMPQLLHTSQVHHESTPQNIDCYLSTIDNTSDIKNELKGIYL